MTSVPGTNPISLTADQIYALAVHAGFSTQPNGNNPLGVPDAVIATALAEFESRSTRPTSNTLNDRGEYSIGPWQINIGGSGNTYAGFNAQQLTNPFNNAAAAYQKFVGAGGRFDPWSTWPNGAPGHAAYYEFYQWLLLAAATAAKVSATNAVEANLEAVSQMIGGNASPAQGTGGSTAGGNSPGPSGGGSSSGSGSGSSAAASALGTTPGILIVVVAIILILAGVIIWGKMFSIQGPGRQVIQIGPARREPIQVGPSSGIKPKLLSKASLAQETGVTKVARTRQTGQHTYHTRTVIVKHQK